MIIHGVSIHSGGGKVLLDQLLLAKTFGEVTYLICDTRYQLPMGISPKVVVHRIRPTLKSRFEAEFILKQIAGKNPSEDILCFSNLPPLFKHKNRVILYLQNALILPGLVKYAENFRVKVRIIYEKLWFNLFLKNVSEVWVQTQWMKDHFLKFYNSNISINPIIPIFPTPNLDRDKKFDFISVTGSAPHKHLIDLIRAWKLVGSATQCLLIIGDQPSPEVREALEDCKEDNLKFVSSISREEIFHYYEQSKVLVLTSKLESYCLPIYEAKNFQLKIIAPREKYVLEACRPDVFIDELSPQGIKDAILKFNLNSIPL